MTITKREARFIIAMLYRANAWTNDVITRTRATPAGKRKKLAERETQKKGRALIERLRLQLAAGRRL
jgi:hypothetical protein